jgi:hypothetical protein
MDTKTDTTSPGDSGIQGPMATGNPLVQTLNSDLQRLNETIAEMVEDGMTVELVRRSRHHTTSGNWGDQMMPVITRKH